MLQAQREKNPQFHNPALLELCPQADRWVNASRALVLRYDKASEQDRPQILGEIRQLQQEIIAFTLQPIPVTFADLPLYIELYSHVSYALQHLNLFLYFHKE